MRYNYQIQGTAAEGQTWTSSGHIDMTDITEVMETAMRLSFIQLTKGQAVYGRPGVGCSGPYAVTKILIERE